MRAQRQLMLSWGILAACGGDDQSTATTMTTVTSVSTTMSASTNPSEDTVTSGPAESSDSGDPTPTGDTAPVEGAPVILSLQSNVSKITAGESVIVTAVLTDPDGVEDIVGGTLSDEVGMIVYGPFVAAGQVGTYSISLSWDAAHQAEPIQFEDMELVRVFRAEFYDQAANKVNKDINLTLTCAEGSACDGVCTDISSNAEHCGACERSCEGGCEAGACLPQWGECIDNNSGIDTCEASCASIGEACVENGCELNSTIRAYGIPMFCVEETPYNVISEPCNKIQDWGPGATAVQCCCTDTS